MPRRKKHPRELAAKIRRAVTPAEAPRPTPFPTYQAVCERRDLQRLVLRAVAATVMTVGASSLGGCYAPECSPSRLGELDVHGGRFVDELRSRQFGDALDELGIGFGLVAHRPAALAGEAVYVAPTPLPTTTPGAPSSATGSTGADGKGQ